MNKKSIGKDRKEIRRRIKNGLDNGVSKQELLDELYVEYYDRAGIATMLAMTVDKERKEKYKLANCFLLGLIILTVIPKLLLGFQLLMDTSIYMLPLVLLLPLINIFFAIGIANYQGFVYKLLGGLTLIGFFKSLARNGGEDPSLIGIEIIVTLVIVVLSFYLGSVLFPHIGFMGPKKDSSGNIIME